MKRTVASALLIAMLVAACAATAVHPIGGPASALAGSVAAASLAGPIGILTAAAIGTSLTFLGWFLTAEPIPQAGAAAAIEAGINWWKVGVITFGALWALKIMFGPRYRELMIDSFKSLGRLRFGGALKAWWQSTGAAHSRSKQP